jgi:hypothetical protein
VIGFESGQAAAIPLVVHLANYRRGSFTTSLYVSLGLGAIRTALLWTGDFHAIFENRARQTVLIVMPVAQLVSSVLIERMTSRRRTTR